MTTLAHRFSRKIVLRKWHIAVALGILALGFRAVLSMRVNTTKVVAANPVFEDIESTAAAMGKVTPVNDYPARANFGGMVEKVFVRLGQKVHAGQMLIQMKDQYAYSRLANARASLESAAVNSENVERSGSQEDRIAFAADLLKARTEQSAAANSLATLKQLAENGSVSESELSAGSRRLQDANTALNALMAKSTERYSNSDVASWKARVAADRAAVDAETVSYANAHIRSPIDGTVYDLPVAQYDFVAAGADLLHVAKMAKLRIHADFDEHDVQKLRPGEPVKITWEASRYQSWAGRVVEAPLAVTDQGLKRVGRATIEVNDERGDLPINTDVTTTVTVERHIHAMTIPREALRSDNGAFYVYRIVDGKLVRSSVQVGIANAMRAEIVQGLAPSDEVALHSVEGVNLSDRMRVERAK
jgi:HlyD family secretion protein